MTFVITFYWYDSLWMLPLTLYTLWWFFIPTMRIRELWPELSLGNKILAIPPVTYSFFLDIFCNLVIGTIMFQEFPREWTLTKRLKRMQLMVSTRPKAARFAKWMCTDFINQFDKGHC